jgi:hypothetical protein
MRVVSASSRSTYWDSLCSVICGRPSHSVRFWKWSLHHHDLRTETHFVLWFVAARAILYAYESGLCIITIYVLRLTLFCDLWPPELFCTLMRVVSASSRSTYWDSLCSAICGRPSYSVRLWEWSLRHHDLRTETHFVLWFLAALRQDSSPPVGSGRMTTTPILPVVRPCMCQCST